MSRLRSAEPAPARRAWWLTVPLAVVTVVFTLLAQIGWQVPGWQWLLGVVFLAAFILVDLTTIHVEVRRHRFGVSVGEVPLLLALFFLSPVTLVVSRSLAALLARLYQRQSWVKVSFNAASLAAAAALASLIVRAGAPLDGGSPRTWLLLAVAVTAGSLATHLAVVGVLTLVQGRMSGGELARAVVPGLVMATANTTIGLIVLLVLRQGPWAVLPLLAMAVISVGAYRAYVQSMRHNQALAEMYELTRAIAHAPHDGTLADVFLGRVREVLQAEYATLWLPASPRHPEVLLSANVDYPALLDLAATPPELRKRAFETGETIAVGPRSGDPHLRRLLARDGNKDAIVVPLRAGSALIGCLEVANRIGDTGYFGPDDVRLLATVAGHAAVAVENSRLVERLRFDAYHDSMTGLPNRRRVSDALADAVAVWAPGEVVAVLILDVSGLRQVNESLGRAAGDQLLREVAGQLREVAPPAALVGRVGGDSFAVTLRLPDTTGAMALAATLRDQVGGGCTVGQVVLDTDVAVGVAVHPQHGADPAILLQRADVASQSAKALASGVQLFNDALESRSARRLGLAADLRQALERDEVEVYFQPKVAIADRRLVGVECLARWEHPAHGSVAPADFVAVAEHTGLLARLTESVLRVALRRAQQWARSGHPLPVAVNLAARTLVDPGFPDRVADLLQEYQVAPELLTLEVTEAGAMGEPDRPLPILRRLSELGVRLAVDDVGTGYSSLSFLRQLPVQELKIDKSFIQGMATDAGDLAIVRTVVDLSRHFGLVAVAEGVESELTLGLLADMGCDIGQGFLFSRPLPYERLEAWMAAQTDAEPSPTGQVRRLRVVS